MFGRACHLSCAKRDTAECCVPGSSMTLRSRCTASGQSSRNEAMELATLVSVRRLARQPRAVRVEPEVAARAAGVLRLQQHVAVVPPLAAELHGVIAHQLGDRRRDVPCLLRAIPRLARGEPQHRAGVAVHVDLGQAAGELVDVRARDADVGAGRQPVALRRGDVVVVVHAAANVHDHRVAEDARPVCRGADARVGASAGEPVVGGPAVLAEEARDRRPPGAGSSSDPTADSSRSSSSSASCRRHRSSSRGSATSDSCSGRAARRRCSVRE